MAKWTDGELRALENDEDQWDWEHAEVAQPSPPEHRGARVLVRFAPEDFDLLDEAADLAGERLTEFIRKAALARAAGIGPPSSMPSR
jgi:hypothetical protein